jgi:hypothetical protein
MGFDRPIRRQEMFFKEAVRRIGCERNRFRGAKGLGIQYKVAKETWLDPLE